MIDDEQLLQIAKTRKSKKFARMSLVGDITRRFVNQKVTPANKRTAKIIALWPSVITGDFAKHSKASQFAGGNLTVIVDSPAYLYQMRLAKQGLIQKLKQKGVTNIKNIRLVIGSIK